jgi:hypothetical protein
MVTLTGASGTLTVSGTDVDGAHRSESVALSNGYTDSETTYAYREVGTVTLNGTAEVEIDTRPVTNRQDDDYNFWIDNQHGIVCSKQSIVHSHRTVRAKYRKSYYHMVGDTVPRYVKRMCVLLTGIDILENERYALNLPGGEGEGSYLKTSRAVENWKRRYRQILEKKREFVGGSWYE